MATKGKIQETRAKIQERLAATTPGTWAKAGGGILVGGIVLGWLAFPYILDKAVAMVGHVLHISYVESIFR